MALLSFIDVESAVEHAHALLWERRHEFRERGLGDLVDWLDPPILAEMLGLKYELVPNIYVAERFTSDAPVGLLDLNESRVVVSEELGPEVARFTGAHELGHYLYHRSKLRQHWERAFDPNRRRPKSEREADLFSATFLMPQRLLLQRIGDSFGPLPLPATDNVQFHLCPHSTDVDADNLDLEYALARARRNFMGMSVVPLHQQFKVSVTAMAIRLEQLRVFSYPTTSYRTDL